MLLEQQTNLNAPPRQCDLGDNTQVEDQLTLQNGGLGPIVLLVVACVTALLLHAALIAWRELALILGRRRVITRYDAHGKRISNAVTKGRSHVRDGPAKRSLRFWQTRRPGALAYAPAEPHKAITRTPKYDVEVIIPSSAVCFEDPRSSTDLTGSKSSSHSEPSTPAVVNAEYILGS